MLVFVISRYESLLTLAGACKKFFYVNHDQLNVKRLIMKFMFRSSIKCFQFVILFSIVFIFVCFFNFDVRYKPEVNQVELFQDKLMRGQFEPNFSAYPKRKDWHDWKFIEYEKSRTGPGEQGKPFELTNPEDIALNQKLFRIEGLYVVVSDKISVNRSVPDTRLSQ